MINKVNAFEEPREMKLKQKNLMIIFGSGGHTTEMLLFLGKTNIFEKYGEIYFVIGHSDTWSLRKVTDYYQSIGIDLKKQTNLKVHNLFRAREVKQSFITSIFTTFLAIIHSFIIIAKLTMFSKIDLVLTNGPGTAVPLCYSYWFISRVMLFNLKSKIIFVESFCRVNSLSLTAKLMRPIIAKFVVQWEDLHKKFSTETILFKEKII